MSHKTSAAEVENKIEYKKVSIKCCIVKNLCDMPSWGNKRILSVDLDFLAEGEWWGIWKQILFIGILLRLKSLISLYLLHREVKCLKKS